MVTEALPMSLTFKRECLAKIHGRYQRAGRPHKSCIPDEFCLNCGYHRKAALRLLNRPLGGAEAIIGQPPNPHRPIANDQNARRLESRSPQIPLTSQQSIKARLPHHSVLPARIN